MLWRDFDALIQEAIPPGRTAVFLWVIQAKPNVILEVRPSTSKSAGMITKYLKYAKSKNTFREFCGVDDNFKTAKALFMFIAFTDDIKNFRSKWYGNFLGYKVSKKYGTLYTLKEMLGMIPDRTFRFQVNISFDTLDIEDFEIRELQNYLSSSATLSTLMQHVHNKNFEAVTSVY